MNETWDWNDLRLFLAVARAGGLAGAVSSTDLSAPTLGRRMTALENALGVELFFRHREGYDLTTAGKELLELSDPLERGALAIDRWRSVEDEEPVVKIAAGTWTSMFIARHLSKLLNADERMALEIVTGISASDLLRREANIGIRNQRPVTPGLAGRRLVQVDFAIYGEQDYVRETPSSGDDRRFTDCRWIAYLPSGPKGPSSNWLNRVLQREAQIRCSTAQSVLEAVEAGMGLCVLPCFIGDTQPGLARVSGTIAELRHDQWLVTHNDDRHDRRISRVGDRLAKLMRSHRILFCGEAVS